MQNFKSYLAEKAAPNFAPWHIKEPSEVQRFMDNYANMSGWKVNKDETVSVTKDFYAPTGVFGDIGGHGHGQMAIMVKYKTAKKFEIVMPDNSNFKSLWGVPDTCSYLGVSSHSLETLEHCTPTIKDTLYFFTPNLKSFDCGKISIAQELKIGSMGKAPLSDLHKYFNVPTIQFYSRALNDMYRKPMLGLLKCNAKILWGSHITKTPQIQEVLKVIQILNKYNSSSIVECQEELIDNDLKDYAEL